MLNQVDNSQDTAAQSVTTVKPCELSPHDIAVWGEMRRANPALYSPYFCYEYTKLIGELRSDAYVAVMRENEKPVAFLPFQGPKPGKSGFARPIGAPMTDYHGVISAPDTSIDIVDFMRGAGIGAFYFNAMPNVPASLTQSEDIAAVSDISKGAKAWRAERDSSYRRHLKSNRRRIRKAEDEIGAGRAVFKCQDPAMFDQLMTWKKQKFAETGKYDVLGAGWTLELLKRLWTSGAELRCDMHVLYFGERLAAIDLGLTDGKTFHSWIVAYDDDLHTYAPGIQLLEELIDASETLGYSRIDLGAGLDGYKRHYASENISVSGGFIPVHGPAAALSQVYASAEKFGQKSLKDAPGKLRRRYSQIAACDETFKGRAKAMLEAVRPAQK